MATIIDIDIEETAPPAFSFPKTAKSPVLRGALAVLKVLSSLKITVALFAMAIFIVFAGTLAQTRNDIWDVVHTYFRSAWVWIPFQIFFPKAFFPESVFPDMPAIPGSMPFFGGWAIGAMMAVNLLAAHLVRFKVQARGSRLWLGLGVIAAGCLLTAGVIVGGSESGWQVMPLLDPSLRILWQLLQGGFAGLILLAGCRVVFGKRAGIVLLHSGVGLMMFSELLVGTTAIESQMHIVEGDTVNFVQDIRTNELAVIDASDPDKNTVVVIPRRFLKVGSKIEHADLPFDIEVVKYLQNSQLDPVKPGIENPATAGLGLELVAVEKPAGTGVSSDSKVDDSAAYVQVFKKGTSASLGTYLVSLLQSQFGESRERTGLSDAELRARYHVGPFVLRMSQPTSVTVDGKPYNLALRFKRTYKPYSLQLHDVRAEKYLGTETPKDYSSIVHLKKDSPDPAERVDRDGVRIWMNNPLRFAGETFYQSNVGADTITREESTGLQVVTNTGWMIPYVSCMIVGVGLLYQFSIALLRFLNRRQAATVANFAAGNFAAGRLHRPAREAAGARHPSGESPFTGAAARISSSMFDKTLVVGALLCCAAATVSMALPPRVPEGSMDLYEAGKIPIIEGGRVKPLDTLARNALQVISNRETFKDDDAKKSLPAIRWLFDVISGSPAAEQHRVFRIDNLDVLARLGLEPRERHLYSLAEIRKKVDDFNADVEKAHEKPPDKWGDYERKLLELDRRIRAFTVIDASFHVPNLPEPDDKIRALLRGRRKALEENLSEAENRLKRGHPPLAVPVRIGEGRIGEGSGSRFEWKPLVSASTREYIDVKVLGERQPDPATAAWGAILQAYAKDSPRDFNQAIEKYRSLLAQDAPPELASAAVNFEAFFNNFSPFFVAWILYIAGFVISSLAWLGWSRPLIRVAFWMSVFTLCLHTLALVARIYISGRPPVTNLYSSAVFIGWGCVVLGLVLELIFRMGIGNVLSEIAGFATLFISFKLAADGDTFTVLQAVLDTQFWLATHVTCVTLGYATTFLAGLLGVFFIIRGMFTTTLSPDVQKVLARMTYGTLCFAIFFSFVGTVLGGLWADDSWGRFWGWDPKENGALMIVLWNALVLHARWDGQVKDRGLAVLAVGGNIVTAWSWFGVNELGVGLHSYGFTAGVVKTMGLFIASQLIIIAVGALPKDLWMSYRPRAPAA